MKGSLLPCKISSQAWTNQRLFKLSQVHKLQNWQHSNTAKLFRSFEQQSGSTKLVLWCLQGCDGVQLLNSRLAFFLPYRKKSLSASPSENGLWRDWPDRKASLCAYMQGAGTRMVPWNRKSSHVKLPNTKLFYVELPNTKTCHQTSQHKMHVISNFPTQRHLILNFPTKKISHVKFPNSNKNLILNFLTSRLMRIVTFQGRLPCKKVFKNACFIHT